MRLPGAGGHRTKSIAALMAAALSLYASAVFAQGSLRPFGISLGDTTCSEAALLLRSTRVVHTVYGSWHASAGEPKALFPNAYFVTAICRTEDGPVQSVVLKAPAGGVGASDALKAYEWIARDYQLVESVPPTKASGGSAWAEFTAGETIAVWELSAGSDMLSLTFIPKASRIEALRRQDEALKKTGDQPGAPSRK